MSDGLPAAKLSLGGCDSHRLPCRFHLDSCSSINTGNLLVHQWLVTKYPDIADSYEQFDDANPFRPNILARALDNDDTENFVPWNITAIFTYKTCYTKVDGTPVKFNFGVGSSVYVNAIVGLPSLTDCKMILDFNESKSYSKAIYISFPLSLTEVFTGSQKSIDFSPADLIQPKQQTYLAEELNITQE